VQITGVRIAGFKSFVDPVEAPIEPGLTGVVGPNGCGKSNILEAVRWGMGAASARALRADDMDSVIFAGSAARPARESAEVSLSLLTAAGERLEIARRIRREMGSSYRINGREARAKDVQILFADASTGANSPALVRQGQVGELIAARPENRRRVLEEAAGVAGLQARRHEADLKLAGALANLGRLDELTAEIEAQGASLRRQAHLAAKHKVLALELRKLEALWHVRRIEAAQAAAAALVAAAEAAVRAEAGAASMETAAARSAEEANAALAPAKEEDQIAEAVARRAETALAISARDLEAAVQAIAAQTAAFTRLREELTRERAWITEAHAAQASLAAEKDRITEDSADQASDPAALNREAENAAAAAADAETARQAAADALARASARLEGAQTALANAKARVAALSTNLAQAESAFATAQKDAPVLGPLEAAQHAARSALPEAEAEAASAHAERLNAQAAAETAHDAARRASAALAAARADIAALEIALARTPNPAPDHLSAKPGYEFALAAALGADGVGDWAALPTRGPPSWPAGVEPLNYAVQAPPALALLIAFTGVLAPDGPSAPSAEMLADLPDGAQLVSKAGGLWRFDGLQRPPGQARDVAVRLERRNHLAALTASLAPLTTAHAAAASAAATAMDAARKANANANTAAAALRVAQTQAAKASAALDAARAKAAETLAKLTRLEAQCGALKGQSIEAAAAALDAEARLQACSPPDPTPLAACTQEALAARTVAENARNAAVLAERAAAARAARVAAIASDAARWASRAHASENRISALELEIANAERAADALQAKPPALEAQRAQEHIAHADAMDRARAAGDQLALAERAAREANTVLRTAEQTASLAREARASAIAQADSARVRIADAIGNAHDALGLDLDGLLAAAGALADTPLRTGPIQDVERRMERLRAERDGAGSVNLRAEEELTEIEDRLAGLARERADVAGAVAKLKAGVARINAEARARLGEAFTKVNAHFATLFATLFEGGEARLALTDSDDPLACGLEIFASPPGKRLTALSLMSGGEQALTATALVFAVFLANPAPLCVLDEVDAPLDDANVERFCRMLEAMKDMTSTRFLVITHNPITMARMDRLLGITMPQAGASQIVSVDLAAAKALAA
jgi:chromosome segregation protein